MLSFKQTSHQANKLCYQTLIPLQRQADINITGGHELLQKLLTINFSIYLNQTRCYISISHSLKNSYNRRKHMTRYIFV